MKNKAEANLGFISAEFQINSKIDLKQVKIDDLTSENAVFMDEQNDDTFNDIAKAVIDKTKNVINQNLVKLGLSPISEDYVTNDPPTTLENIAKKEEAKNKIINSVSDAMTVAQREGRKYTLDDLKDLEIPESDFSVSFQDDIAILKIDGFEFKLNSDFQLYE